MLLLVSLVEFIYTCTKHEWLRARIENMWPLCDHYPLQRLVPIIDYNPIPAELNSASEFFSTAVNKAIISK